MHLTAGSYLFRTGHDAQIQLGDRTAVRVVATPSGKDAWPDPDAVVGLSVDKGNTASDRVPTPTVRW